MVFSVLLLNLFMLGGLSSAGADNAGAFQYDMP